MSIKTLRSIKIFVASVASESNDNEKYINIIQDIYTEPTLEVKEQHETTGSYPQVVESGKVASSPRTFARAFLR